LYEKLLAKGEVQGLEGEVLKRTVQENTIKQVLLDLIFIRRLPFSYIEWPEFHAFVKAINREVPPFSPYTIQQLQIGFITTPLRLGISYDEYFN
jgi:hypothetical protein